MQSESNTAAVEEEITALEQRMQRAGPYRRDHLRAEVQKAISTLIAQGDPVPQRLRKMNRTLEEEAIEDMFDNMPV